MHLRQNDCVGCSLVNSCCDRGFNSVRITFVVLYYTCVGGFVTMDLRQNDCVGCSLVNSCCDREFNSVRITFEIRFACLMDQCIVVVKD